MKARRILIAAMWVNILAASATAETIVVRPDSCPFAAQAPKIITLSGVEALDLNPDRAEASEALDFEKAAILRDRLRALAHVQLQQGINPETIDEADLFAAHQAGGHTCIQVFFFRSGQNWGNRAYFPRHDKAVDVAEVLDSFLAQFYDDREPPKLVIVSHDVPGRALLEEALSVRAERRVEVLMPQRGEKREVMAQAVMNARESLARGAIEGIGTGVAAGERERAGAHRLEDGEVAEVFEGELVEDGGGDGDPPGFSRHESVAFTSLLSSRPCGARALLDTGHLSPYKAPAGGPTGSLTPPGQPAPCSRR